MVKRIMSFLNGENKAKTLDPDTKKGITAWLEWSISRFSGDDNIVKKLKHALKELETGNYEEAEWVMKRYIQPLRTRPKTTKLTRSQFTEKSILTIWLEKLKRLQQIKEGGER